MGLEQELTEIGELSPHDLSEMSSAIGVLSVIVFALSTAVFLAGDHPRRRVLMGIGVLLLVTGLLTDKGGGVGLWLLAASVLMWIPACLFGAV